MLTRVIAIDNGELIADRYLPHVPRVGDFIVTDQLNSEYHDPPSWLEHRVEKVSFHINKVVILETRYFGTLDSIPRQVFE